MNEVKIITNKSKGIVTVMLNGIEVKILPYSEHSTLSEMYVEGFIDAIKKTHVFMSCSRQVID